MLGCCISQFWPPRGPAGSGSGSGGSTIPWWYYVVPAVIGGVFVLGLVVLLLYRCCCARPAQPNLSEFAYRPGAYPAGVGAPYHVSAAAPYYPPTSGAPGAPGVYVHPHAAYIRAQPYRQAQPQWPAPVGAQYAG